LIKTINTNAFLFSKGKPLLSSLKRPEKISGQWQKPGYFDHPFSEVHACISAGEKTATSYSKKQNTCMKKRPNEKPPSGGKKQAVFGQSNLGKNFF